MSSRGTPSRKPETRCVGVPPAPHVSSSSRPAARACSKQAASSSGSGVTISISMSEISSATPRDTLPVSTTSSATSSGSASATRWARSCSCRLRSFGTAEVFPADSTPRKSRENAAMTEIDCVFCDLAALRAADLYLENAFCAYASTRDPRDPPDVLPGSGIIVPLAHRPSPFDFTPEEWAATGELLIKAKAAQDDCLAPDGYFLCWSPFPRADDDVPTTTCPICTR